jgi:hypothetical protein
MEHKHSHHSRVQAHRLRFGAEWSARTREGLMDCETLPAADGRDCGSNKPPTDWPNAMRRPECIHVEHNSCRRRREENDDDDEQRRARTRWGARQVGTWKPVRVGGGSDEQEVLSVRKPIGETRATEYCSAASLVVRRGTSGGGACR